MVVENDAMFVTQNNDILKDALNIIVKSVESGPYKVRWNACHALKNIMFNHQQNVISSNR